MFMFEVFVRIDLRQPLPSFGQTDMIFNIPEA